MCKNCKDGNNFDFLFAMVVMAMCFPLGHVSPTTIINIYSNKSEVEINDK